MAAAVLACAVTLAACQGGTKTAKPQAPPATAGSGASAASPQASAAGAGPAVTQGGGPQPGGQEVACPAGEPTVRNPGDLKVALASAKPGAVIRLADGTYAGGFTIARSGTAAQPIWLCGSRGAVLDGQDDTDYILHIDHASYVRLSGFSVRNGKKGVMADGVQHGIIAGLSVSAIGDEAIHLRSFSSDNLVTGNVIRNTGNRSEKFGEGIYVGSASSNWCKYSDCRPDNSDRNSVIGNDIAGTTAENIDIKEGTTGGIISGNTLSADRLTEADSWIDLKGNGWTVVDNTGQGGGNIKDGIQTHVESDGWGRRNIIRNNALTVNGGGFGVYIHDGDRTQNVVGCDNRVQGASRGFSNVKCS
ncbi:right-handed parallel beta-helix repeat-containing protein [Frankia sp. CiP1_Cm_nod2]|uniref:right-handed parallel beta-helix repeat-containing protein n=1 Tax=Frankia sp. CiP1_Cm_nod2 TaxID=2897161 RepID=UPI002024DF41